MKSDYFKLIIIFLLRKIYRVFNLKKTTIDEYPITHKSIKNFYKPLPLTDYKNSNDGFFLRYFNSNIKNKYFLDNFFLLKYFHFLKYELFYGKIINSFIFKSDKYSYLIPITPFKNIKIKIKIKYFNHKDGVKEKTLNIDKEKFTYLKINLNEKLEIKSHDKFIRGNPLILNSKQRNFKKNVLLIYIDGLPSFNKNLSFEKLMPNTRDFFSNGIYFNNNYSSSEWTMPSFASIFTGLYSHKHKIFHPRKKYDVSKFITISSLFKKEEYVNFQIGSNARSNPAYGYYNGFDRLIYKRNMGCDDVIFNYIEHSNTFKNSNQFNLITLFDLHHFLNGSPSIMSQSKLNNDYLKLYKNKKSIHQEYDEIKIEILQNEIKRLDFHLSIIYNYILKNFDPEENLVALFSDHGHSYLGKNNDILSDNITKVPLMIKDITLNNKFTEELTSNVDIFKSILHLSNINYLDINNDSSLPKILGGDEKNKYVISESIYPNTPYYCKIRNKDGILSFKTEEKIKNDKIIFNNYEYNLLDYMNKKVENSKLENLLLEKVLKQIEIFNN